jgi:hypothetical protein
MSVMSMREGMIVDVTHTSIGEFVEHGFRQKRSLSVVYGGNATMIGW